MNALNQRVYPLNVLRFGNMPAGVLFPHDRIGSNSTAIRVPSQQDMDEVDEIRITVLSALSEPTTRELEIPGQQGES